MWQIVACQAVSFWTTHALYGVIYYINVVDSRLSISQSSWYCPYFDLEFLRIVRLE